MGHGRNVRQNKVAIWYSTGEIYWYQVDIQNKARTQDYQLDTGSNETLLPTLNCKIQYLPFLSINLRPSPLKAPNSGKNTDLRGFIPFCKNWYFF